MEASILVVDDDRDFLEVMTAKLFSAGFSDCCPVNDSSKAAELVRSGAEFDIALIDMTMPKLNGVELLREIKSASPLTECIMVTAVNDARVAVTCLKTGAYDYLVKPVSDEDLSLSITRALEHKRLLDILEIEKSRQEPKLKNPGAFSKIVTRSPKMLKVLKEAELHARSSVPVMITGESGTGKELLARSIHAASPRAESPFTPVNMASVSPGLFEAEFFGHVRGAFTGAESNRAGFLESTDTGTIFLDEIGNLPMELQGKLLRVLQDGEYMKLGTSKKRMADVRFIAATNEDLEDMIRRGRFRKDLFYRIRGGWLHLPPLRERRGDIMLLVRVFIDEYLEGPNSCMVEPEAQEILLAYDYPGNVRELKSIVQAALNLTEKRAITVSALPGYMRPPASRANRHVDFSHDLSLAHSEKEHIQKVLQLTGGNKSRAARMLGIGLSTLRRKVKAYGL